MEIGIVLLGEILALMLLIKLNIIFISSEFLNYAFNPNVVFDVEIPNYRIAVEPAGLNYTYLDSEMPKMYRFIVGHPMRADGLSPTKQKQLLAVILESLHKDEAALLVKLLKKNLGIKHLNLNLVLEAFPGI